jgi:hypothetical protein
VDNGSSDLCRPPTLGLVFFSLGLMLVAAAIRLFITLGKGTLAPWNPTRKLVKASTGTSAIR